MTPLERAIAAVNNTARVQNIAGDQQGVIGDAPLHIVVNPGDIARAVLQAIREPIDEWLAYQLEHGRAPDGYPVEMTEQFAAGRRAAFQATQAMIDAAMGEG